MSVAQRGLGPDDRKPSRPRNLSDSEASIESNSLSQDSNTEVSVKPPSSLGLKRNNRRDSEWEILEGLKEGQRYDSKPDPFSGYLHKKRKWPLKGWHKRYFVLEKGILIYGKSPSDVSKGKIHGTVDIGLSVISAKQRRKRLDIDAEEFIYHIKAKQLDVFCDWVEQLKKHRLYRQHVLNYGHRDGPASILRPTDHTTPSKLPLTRKLASEGTMSPPLRLHWCLESGPMQVAVTELNQAQQALNQLSRILDRIEQSSADIDNCVEGFSPNVKKDRRKFGLRKKKSGKGSSVDLTAGISPNKAPGGDTESSSPISQSGLTTPSPSRPQSLTAPAPGDLAGCHSSSELHLASDFFILAKDIYTSLRSVIFTLSNERERLKSGVDEIVGPGTAALRSQLSQILQQNTELRHRLANIHQQADLSAIPETPKLGHTSLSYSSSCISGSEFYDAEDTLDGAELPVSDTSSVAPSNTSEEGSISSEPSDMADSEYNPTTTFPPNGGESRNLTGRRSQLPAPRPNTEGLSLWNLLTKNIGKDLSQVSMPVALNEPLSMLQRMCEELEYSELLDKASELTDPYERMVHVAAFAVSSYGSAYFRAGSKPFNPLLGETYECIREDRGFRFIAEQVSHHPPISACYAESKNFKFWQDIRIKTKFWGKSMEFQPTGFVNVRLERPNDGGYDLYRWNKVTTCVHNLFGGQRWVDQYGELSIAAPGLTCKLTFVKASYWSAKRHEVHGVVVDNTDSKVVRNLFGKWSEALYCGIAPAARCVWRPGTMPPDYELYYGFTRFAIELNELDPEGAKYLPVTDTRFRPDQRMLEEGDLEGAETKKLQLEAAQRERRKRNESLGRAHQPRWFKKRVLDSGEEVWEYDNKYWEVRRNPGFVNLTIEPLW